MPIDLSAVNWLSVAVLAVLAFVSSFVGSLVIRNAFVVAIVTAILFTVLYVAWVYYPHGFLPTIPRPR